MGETNGAKGVEPDPRKEREKWGSEGFTRVDRNPVET